MHRAKTMKIELKPGERITVTLEGTDGEIEVAFNESDVRVTTDLPDSSGREGIIYQECFGDGDRALGEAPSKVTIHQLAAGLTLCGFGNGTVPGDWPYGHRWAGDVCDVNCQACRDAVQLLVEEEAE